MNINECYRILGISASAADAEIKSAFKKLAHKYHPDKNPDKIEWATNAMAGLNVAYTTIMKQRFQAEETVSAQPAPAPAGGKKAESGHSADREYRQKREKPGRERAAADEFVKGEIHDRIFTIEFVKVKDRVKDLIYRYFQYGLYNLARRNQTENRRMFDDIVLQLRRGYHRLNKLLEYTEDRDFIRHFTSYRDMIYNFYMSSECINVIDYFSESLDFQAYRLFKKGDDTLHPTEKEIFFDRHNRGYFKKEYTGVMLLKSEQFLREALEAYPGSTWAIESGIKLRYALSLKDYIKLFFTEELE